MNLRPLISALSQWVMPGGNPSRELHSYMRELDAKVRELDAQQQATAATVLDHEDRITDLEP